MPYTMIHGGDMNKGDGFLILCAGFFMGIAFSGLVYLYGNNVTLEIERAKNDCERSLPRDQHCYIIAVPPSKD